MFIYQVIHKGHLLKASIKQMFSTIYFIIALIIRIFPSKEKKFNKNLFTLFILYNFLNKRYKMNLFI